MGQKPSVGRVVIFKGEDSNGAEEHPAIITRVWNDDCVNLTVLFDAKTPESRTSVQIEGVAPQGATNWSWPARV